MTFLPFVFFAALVASAGILAGNLIPYLVRQARRRGLADRPDDTRKHHDRPTPPIGGMIIIPLFMMIMPFLGFSPLAHPALYIAITIVLVTGFWDDLRDVKPGIKLLAQMAAALILATSGEATLTHLGHLFGVEQSIDLKFLSIPFTAVCFIFFINAMNMIDGVDGLSGSISFVMLGWLSVACIMGGDLVHATAGVLMMGLLFGFLVHNMRYPGHKRATVFMGDAGSMSLGVIIAWLGINMAEGAGAAIPPISMAFIILLPIIDAFALFIARRKSGRSAFTPGRDHMHHQLLAAGFTPGQVTVILATATFILGAIAVLGPTFWGLHDGVMTVLWILILLGYTAFLIIRAPALYKE